MFDRLIMYVFIGIGIASVIMAFDILITINSSNWIGVF